MTKTGAGTQAVPPPPLDPQGERRWILEVRARSTRLWLRERIGSTRSGAA